MLQPRISPTKRIVWIDVVKFTAIFLVICVHCSDPFNVSPEARSNPEFNFWGSIYGSMLRPCVPLFVMITGALLLPVKQSLQDFYKRRLFRIALPFLIWSILYNLYPWITGLLGFPPSVISHTFAYASPTASQSLGEACKNILLIPFQFNEYTIPMWYLYMLIGLYLYLPFFSAWTEKASIGQKKIFLGLWTITLFLPYVNQFFTPNIFGKSTWNTFDTFYYFAGFNGYLLLGRFIAKDLNPWSIRKTLLITIPMFLVGYMITYLGFRYITANPHCSESEMELFFLYCSPNVMLMSAAVMLLLRKISIRSQVIVHLFANIAKCALGIYLVHYFVVGLGYALASAFGIPVAIRIPITATFVFLLSWSFVSLMFKLFPQYNKWLMG